MTTLPRWTTRATLGLADYDHALPVGLGQEMARAAHGLGVTPSTLLLAAHARVLSTLTGEGVVTCGTSAHGRLRARTVAVGGSWRDLVGAVASAASAASAEDAGGTLAESSITESTITEPSFESVVEPSERAEPRPGGYPDSVLLRMELVRGDEPAVLSLRYRTDAIDADYAARLAGYHARCLELIVADPDAQTDAATLVSPEEIRHQISAFAGEVRELPDRRIHELFEDRVRAHPDRPAAAQGNLQWTYADLNQRANNIGRHLLDCGLGTESVVAVVSGRDLPWMASVLAVLKSGGVYLPIDPEFPADRVARVLRRSGCRFVLTRADSREALDEAIRSLPTAERPQVSVVDDVLGGAPDGNAPDGAASDGAASADIGLGVRVSSDQLAYMYFTSGSTGEPKGAMCEHAGMVNHVLAKIRDLQIGPGDTVAQTAPQCFDISLWQLVSALVVGGRTLVVPQDDILDVQRFVDTIVCGGVTILQVVPSYLEAVLSYLESRDRALPSLRYVSVTGEAVKAELTQRWFSGGRAIPMVNAYGLTETSDDTNHEVMTGPPDGPRVPLGRPIQNVRIYVVDDDLVPVPLGAPGEIVFSGVCVGRGYVNDPERTARVYLRDPYHRGERLYRSGDIGAWRPDGKLEFWGRRDHQVKISGFRIEMGEIENALARAPGVRDAAVVVPDVPGRSRRLVGFYVADELVEPETLRAFLRERLPSYMVPHDLHHRPRLPLTANGKTDRAALLALAVGLDGSPERHRTPEAQTALSPAEQRIAAAWASVLGVPVGTVSARDHFFDSGGNSLAAVKLAIALDRKVTLRELRDHPVLADLARLLDAASSPAA